MMRPALLSWGSLHRRVPSATRQLKSCRSDCSDPSASTCVASSFVHIEEMDHRRSHRCDIGVVEAHRDIAVEDLELGDYPRTRRRRGAPKASDRWWLREARVSISPLRSGALSWLTAAREESAACGVGLHWRISARCIRALDGRRAVTHWSYCAELARRFPAVHVEPDPIFVRDGTIWTSAGVTAGIDLALAWLEEDLDSATALAVARYLVVFLKRPGGQAQFSEALSLQSAEDEFGALHQMDQQASAGDLSLPRLARASGRRDHEWPQASPPWSWARKARGDRPGGRGVDAG